jgi:hypothetical protein
MDVDEECISKPSVCLPDPMDVVHPEQKEESTVATDGRQRTAGSATALEQASMSTHYHNYFKASSTSIRFV